MSTPIFRIGALKRLLLLTLIFSACNCDSDKLTAPVKTTENKMYVYSNSGKTFYLTDYETFEVVREITLDVPDTLYCYGMRLSTNKDYLFFKAFGSTYPKPPFYFVLYDIKQEHLHSFFDTGFRYGGPIYFISAQNHDAPGLIYAHVRDYGTFSIDLLEQKIIEFISDEHDFVLDKRIYHSPDEKWTVAHKNWSGSLKGSFSELEFYSASSGLHDLQFVLNEEDRDSISVYEFAFSKDNKLYISFQLSNARSRGIESYFGSYYLETKQIYRSPIKFPWSLNGYYMAYSPKRHEAYLVSGYDRFYIINTENYIIKETITLTDKVIGPSGILIRPDENVAFVSCPNSDVIFVIDLNKRRILSKIAISEPYNMIIP